MIPEINRNTHPYLFFFLKREFLKLPEKSL